MRKVCVYCGSKSGGDPVYAAAARDLGRLLAEQSRTLVFGGGSVGLMGHIADAVLQHDGQVIGVIPHALSGEELLHPKVQQMHVVADMHARKAQMAELADAFIAMPGGFGTMEELFEVLTWAQLGFHAKPTGFLNTGGYYNLLLQFIDQSVEAGFLQPRNRDLFIVEDDPERLLQRLKNHQMPTVKVWNGPDANRP